jgi:hypothetical protein
MALVDPGPMKPDRTKPLDRIQEPNVAAYPILRPVQYPLITTTSAMIDPISLPLRAVFYWRNDRMRGISCADYWSVGVPRQFGIAPQPAGLGALSGRIS